MSDSADSVCLGLTKYDALVLALGGTSVLRHISGFRIRQTLTRGERITQEIRQFVGARRYASG